MFHQLHVKSTNSSTVSEDTGKQELSLPAQTCSAIKIKALLPKAVCAMMFIAALFAEADRVTITYIYITREKVEQIIAHLPYIMQQ